jgi:DNA-binding NtrC family response regulator
VDSPIKIISPAMQAVWQKILTIKKTEIPILLTGESGVGKSLLARVIHQQSARAEYPFIALDTAVLPESLFESEVFGYERGAFTGATGRKPGILEQSHQGTLFLDEIGNLSLASQAKLLQVLQEKRFRRLGGQNFIELDFRLISATNQDLPTRISLKAFREDLYYRINGLTLQIPPLRQRREDIVLLAGHFLAQWNQRYQKQLAFSNAAWKLLQNYPWPGNIREMQSLIERLVITSPATTIQPEDFPLSFQQQALLQAPAQGEIMPLTEMEQAYILQVLKAVGGNKQAASRVLGISLNKLKRKLKVKL